MTAPAVDARDHLDALLAVLSTPLNGDVYEPGKVPGESGNEGTLPDIFAVLFLERRFMPSEKMPKRAHRTGWRLIARCTGRTVREAEWAVLQVSTTLEGTRLSVDGSESTPVHHENTGEVQRDADTRRSIDVELTYSVI